MGALFCSQALKRDLAPKLVALDDVLVELQATGYLSRGQLMSTLRTTLTVVRHWRHLGVDPADAKAVAVLTPLRRLLGRLRGRLLRLHDVAEFVGEIDRLDALLTPSAPSSSAPNASTNANV